ncbi:hypothetical protein Scep_002273 [Stephania cephalantha]|uniref:Uncharacterized protein n=1 Tax=Stephania cephalantha TaxID=152367 RepID=A0AAP0L9M4_9MAGN
MATTSWMQLFKRICVRNFVAPSSDHRALIVNVAYWRKVEKANILGLRIRGLKKKDVEKCEEFMGVEFFFASN